MNTIYTALLQGQSGALIQGNHSEARILSPSKYRSRRSGRCPLILTSQVKECQGQVHTPATCHIYPIPNNASHKTKANLQIRGFRKMTSIICTLFRISSLALFCHVILRSFLSCVSLTTALLYYSSADPMPFLSSHLSSRNLVMQFLMESGRMTTHFWPAFSSFAALNAAVTAAPLLPPGAQQS